MCLSWGPDGTILATGIKPCDLFSLKYSTSKHMFYRRCRPADNASSMCNGMSESALCFDTWLLHNVCRFPMRLRWWTCHRRNCTEEIAIDSVCTHNKLESCQGFHCALSCRIYMLLAISFLFLIGSADTTVQIWKPAEGLSSPKEGNEKQPAQYGVECVATLQVGTTLLREESLL